MIGATALELLERFERDAPVRLLGVGVSGLAPTSGTTEEDPQLRLIA